MNNNDILESVSSGIDGKKNPQNGGLDEIANELRRCCELYEEKLRNGEKHVSRFEVEQRVAEVYAKQRGLWIPMDKVFELSKEFTFKIPSESNNTQNTLQGKTFVITGSLEKYSNRDELKSIIESNGGKVSGSVSAKTFALINNDIESSSSKNKKAKSLGVQIINEEQFMQLLN